MCSFGTEFTDNTYLISYKDYNTPARLGELTDSKLAVLGVSDKDDRGRVLSALNAAGFRTTAIAKAKQKRRIADAVGPSARDEESSTKHGEPSTVKQLIQICGKKKRAR